MIAMIRSSAAVIRSIRQISLHREWERLRQGHRLPHFADFHFDERAGDASEMTINEVVRDNARLRFLCHEAGERVVNALGGRYAGQFLDEALSADIVADASPAWNACIDEKLPVASHVDYLDEHQCPVRMEFLYLPFSANHRDVHYMVTSFNFVSRNARYEHHGLLQTGTRIEASRKSFVIDPDLTWAEKMREANDIEFVDARAP